MIKAVIFDLDGVLVTTDELHFKAWKQLADELGIENFTKADNARQRGVSRMASLEVVLEKTDRKFSDAEKAMLAEKKNDMYVKALSGLSRADVLPGVFEFIEYIRSKGIKAAVGSASKNTPLILEKTELADKFDAVSCGLDTSKSKPDPEVFLIAAKKLGTPPEECIVIEDSDAGIEAAKAGGMYVLAVGAAKANKNADYSAENLNEKKSECGFDKRTDICKSERIELIYLVYIRRTLFLIIPGILAQRKCRQIRYTADTPMKMFAKYGLTLCLKNLGV